MAESAAHKVADARTLLPSEPRWLFYRVLKQMMGSLCHRMGPAHRSTAKGAAVPPPTHTYTHTTRTLHGTLHGTRAGLVGCLFKLFG